jgi:hypothetical protein
VSAGCDREAESFDRQSAENKSGARARIRGGKQDQRGHREKETGWQDEQSGEFHDRGLFRFWFRLWFRLWECNKAWMKDATGRRSRWQERKIERGALTENISGDEV